MKNGWCRDQHRDAKVGNLGLTVRATKACQNLDENRGYFKLTWMMWLFFSQSVLENSQKASPPLPLKQVSDI